jgi:hypothetical protein
LKRRTSAALVVLCAASALADGGRVRLHQDAGPFRVTVFTAPEPLTAGPADISVLVQDRASGETLLDARVAIALRAPGASQPRIIAAARGSNRLFQSAAVELAAPGAWDLTVTVGRSGAIGRVSCVLPVGPPDSRFVAIWPYLALPPVGVALYALGAVLLRGRRRA